MVPDFFVEMKMSQLSPKLFFIHSKVKLFCDFKSKLNVNFFYLCLKPVCIDETMSLNILNFYYVTDSS